MRAAATMVLPRPVGIETRARRLALSATSSSSSTLSWYGRSLHGSPVIAPKAAWRVISVAPRPSCFEGVGYAWEPGEHVEEGLNGV